MSPKEEKNKESHTENLDPKATEKDTIDLNDFRNYKSFDEKDYKRLVAITSKSVELLAFLIEAELAAKFINKGSADKIYRSLIEDLKIEVTGFIFELEEKQKWVPRDILYFIQPLFEMACRITTLQEREPSEYMKRVSSLIFNGHSLRRFGKEVREKCE